MSELLELDSFPNASEVADDNVADFVPANPRRLRAAKRAFTTRRVDLAQAYLLRTANAAPRIGDLVLARVLQPGQHRRLELPCGRRSNLYAGDEIIVAFGARYASDQFEGMPPRTLEACHLVAGGGVAALAEEKHAKMKAATKIAPIGLLCDAGGAPLNLRQFAIPALALPEQRPPVIVVLGTAMNSGKTTAVAGLVRGAVENGERVGVAKATGTGSGGDLWSALDAGASLALDFTDAGHPSTYKIGGDNIEQALCALVAELARAHVDRIIVEIADGLLFEETASLVRSATFAAVADAVVLAAGDSMGAIACERLLQQLGYGASALTGLFTAAPLAMREVASLTTTPVVATDELLAFDPLRTRLRLPEVAQPMPQVRTEGPDLQLAQLLATG